jgi:hypothetical protein
VSKDAPRPADGRSRDYWTISTPRRTNTQLKADANYRMRYPITAIILVIKVCA